MESIWTKTANDTLLAVLEYTVNEFSERRARILAQKIFKTANLISAFPNLYAKDNSLKHGRFEYRSAKVINELKLVYRIQKDTIFFEYCWDVRLPASFVLSKLDNPSPE